MKWTVRRTKINAYDQGDVPPKFEATIVLVPTDVTETITAKDIDNLIKKAMGQFEVPDDAGLIGELVLNFRWDEPLPPPPPPPG